MIKIPEGTPVDIVLGLKRQGLTDSEIVEKLKAQGYSPTQVADALTQADIKRGVEGMRASALEPEEEEVPEPPRPPTPGYARLPPERLEPAAPGIREHDIQQLIESIIEERWQEVVSSVGDINVWKSRVEDDLASIKQEMIRVEHRFSNLQSAILGKVEEYNKTMQDVGSDVKALEKVLGKILEPLSTNIKELSRITAELKKKK